MSDEAALRQAIRDDPDDDTIRLVYADWLEENGDPARAEFIRVQIALATIADDDPARAALASREAFLFSRHADAWRDGTEDLPGWVVYRRGFIGHIDLSEEDFLEHGEALLARVPITSVSLSEGDGFIADLITSPLLARVRDLRMSGISLRGQTLGRLLRSAHLAGLGRLDLTGHELGPSDARTLVRADVPPGLHELILNDNNLGDDGIELLATAPWLDRLTRLELGGNDLSPRGLGVLLDSLEGSRLRHLGLGHNGALEAEGCDLLAQLPVLNGLVELDLARTGLEAEGLILLVQSERASALRILDLSGNYLGSGVRLLAEAPFLGGLTRLDLSWDINDIGDEGIAAIASSPHLRKLCWLDLSGNNVGPAGLIALAESPNLSCLFHLDLFHNRIGSRGAEALAQGNFRRLTLLNLCGTEIGLSGLHALAQSENLTHVIDLDLTENAIDRAGVQELIASPHLPDHCTLSLDRTVPEQDLLNARFDHRVRYR